MKKILTKYQILVFYGILLSCNSSHTEYGNTNLLSKFNLTKISALQKNPAEFKKDTIRIIGELRIDLENKAIFHNFHSIWINSFKPATRIDSVWKNMNHKKVEIIGLYESGKTGHLGLYKGQFKEVYYIKTE